MLVLALCLVLIGDWQLHVLLVVYWRQCCWFMATDHFSGPGRAKGPARVFVCPDNNF